MGKRRKISHELIGEVVVDEFAYAENKSSKNARKILDKSEQIEIEIWCDKHYYKRLQLGDENGIRKGIGEDKIKELVIKSLKHLLYYSFKITNFSFVNFIQSNRYTRTVIQESSGDEMLNIVTEFHHLVHNKYQVTVITAMEKNDFDISMGQYALEITADTSILRKKDVNKITDISVYI